MGRGTTCLCCSPRRSARRGARAMRVCPGEARALQSAAQRDLRQRATQNCDRQNSEIYLESATACDRSAVGQFAFTLPLNSQPVGFDLVLLVPRAVVSRRLADYCWNVVADGLGQRRV